MERACHPNRAKLLKIRSNPSFMSSLVLNIKAPSSTYKHFQRQIEWLSRILLEYGSLTKPFSFAVCTVTTSIPFLLHSTSSVSANADIRSRNIREYYWRHVISLANAYTLWPISHFSFSILRTTVRSWYMVSTALTNSGGAPYLLARIFSSITRDWL